MANGTSFRKTGLVLFLAVLLPGIAANRAGAVRDIFPMPRKMDAPEIKGQPDPGTLQNFRGQVGKSYYFEVTGAIVGTVWGTGVYTDDSHLATVAVHAGLLQVGQKAVIKVTMLAGQASYVGSVQNGVTSHPYQEWGGSYRIEAVRPHVEAVRPHVKVKVKVEAAKGGVLADPGNLSGYQDKVGKTFLFQVTGKITGPVWGTGIYTDDSDLGTAAVHAGILKKGQKAVVKVTIVGGQANYQGSAANGVTTQNWGDWNGSYKIEVVKKIKPVKNTDR